MPIQQDDVVFLSEATCPEPYSDHRVPLYRVVNKNSDEYGEVLTEQQVLLKGLHFSGFLGPKWVAKLQS